MRKGLLLSAAGLLLVGGSTAYGACTPVLKCASLGYKYSSSECSGSGVACPFDTSKYFCVEPCTYTVTKATCDSQCKNVGDKGCTKNGTAYYEACGSNKCSSGQTCNNGTCKSSMLGTVFSCCDDVGYGCSRYDYSSCKSYTSEGDCSDVVTNYKSQGCSPLLLECSSGGYPIYVYHYALFKCM